jgi:hypothetical protein
MLYIKYVKWLFLLFGGKVLKMDFMFIFNILFLSHIYLRMINPCLWKDFTICEVDGSTPSEGFVLKGLF